MLWNQAAFCWSVQCKYRICFCTCFYKYRNSLLLEHLFNRGTQRDYFEGRPESGATDHPRHVYETPRHKNSENFGDPSSFLIEKALRWEAVAFNLVCVCVHVERDWSDVRGVEPYGSGDLWADLNRTGRMEAPTTDGLHWWDEQCLLGPASKLVNHKLIQIFFITIWSSNTCNICK